MVASLMGSNAWSVLWTVIRIAIVSYAIVLVLIAVFQSHFIYFPDRSIIATPKRIGLDFEDVNFLTDDGIILHGWYIPARNQRGVLLFCHGNAGNISHRLDSIAIFNHLGLSTFIFDYRGYGKSQGKVSEKGTYNDAEAAWRYLIRLKDIAPNEIIIFGRSLGSSIASWLAKQHRPRGLIVESSFTSVPELASDLYPFFPVKLISRFRYDTLGSIAEVRCPLLVIHSRNDEIIPFVHGQKLFEIARDPKQFLEISGTHNEGFITSGRTYVGGLSAFISGLKQ